MLHSLLGNTDGPTNILRLAARINLASSPILLQLVYFDWYEETELYPR